MKFATCGGNCDTAQTIGAMNREAGLNSQEDGTRDRCTSARTYVVSDDVERVHAYSTNTRTGLMGYHLLNSRRTNQMDEDMERDRIFKTTTAAHPKRLLPPMAEETVPALMSNNRTTHMT